MKNICRVTRPAWADTQKWEWAMILLASIGVATLSRSEDKLEGFSNKHFLSTAPNYQNRGIDIIVVIVVTAGCLLFIKLYKYLSVGCYPATFVYAFYHSSDSNSDGLKRVVGYFYLKPDMKTGEILVEGASYTVDSGQLDLQHPVGFKSTHIHGTLADGQVICNIWYDVDKQNANLRNYTHAVLRFCLHNKSGDDNNGVDLYAGYMHSTQKEYELRDAEVVRSKGYAELYKRGIIPEADILTHLAKGATARFAKLDDMLSEPPQPTLWERTGPMRVWKRNYWGDDLPTPQAVIQNDKLYRNLLKNSTFPQL